MQTEVGGCSDHTIVYCFTIDRNVSLEHAACSGTPLSMTLMCWVESNH